MTLTIKKIESLKKKIADIKKKLADEKKKVGTYEDSRGLRYIPTRYFIQLEDFKGALTYLKWFNKNFPGDSGIPEFIFEQCIIHFKADHFLTAEKLVLKTFDANPYWISRYFKQPVQPFDFRHTLNTSMSEYTEVLEYDCDQVELFDFTEWLQQLWNSQYFKNKIITYIELKKQIDSSDNASKRENLMYQLSGLLNQ